MEEAFSTGDQETILEAAEIIIKYSNYATSFLTEIFKNKEKAWEFRSLLAEIMVQIKDENLIPCLIVVLTDYSDNEYVRGKELPMLLESWEIKEH